MNSQFIPIVFTIDEKFLAPTYIAISSLIERAKDDTNYDIIVLYQGKVNEKVLILKELINGSCHKMSILDISNVSINAVKTTKVWPSIVYVRLYLTSILAEYDKVIFSDVDVLFQGDLSEVYHEDLTGYEWGGVAAEVNDFNAIIHQYYEDNKHPYIYWAGFMILNLKEMREKDWEGRCNTNLEKYKDKLFMCDLEILNLTADNIKRLPFRYVYLQALYDAEDVTETDEWVWLKRVYEKEYLKQEKENVIIVHYAGKGKEKIGKPWLRMRPPEYYKKYLTTLPKALRRQNNIQKYIENAKLLVKIILRRI